MRIGVVGAGNVGGTLGRRFAEAGHAVAYAARDGSNARAVADCDLVLLAVPWTAVEDALRPVGALEGRIVVDATNPLLERLAGLAVGRDDSQGERVARLVPKAKVVKAFNTIGFQVMANPLLGGGRKALLTVASDHADAKRTVIELGASLGFEAVDFGPLANARYTEPLAMVWIYMAHVQGRGPDFALTLTPR